MREPTYTAPQILEMIKSLPMDRDAVKVLVDLIDEEMSLYTPEDMPILIHASMILFTRALLLGSLKSFGKEL